MSRSISVLLVMAFLVTARDGRADSFLTSINGGSKVARRVGPEAYRGAAPLSPRSLKGLVPRAVSTIQRGNLAVTLDTLRIVHSVGFDQPEVKAPMRRALVELGRQGPQGRLAQGYNLVLHNAQSRRGAALVRQAAAQLSADSAAQVAAFQVLAQRDAFGEGRGEKWEQVTPLKREAARYLKRAEALEAQARHPRPLVREMIKQAKDYAGLYNGYGALLK